MAGTLSLGIALLVIGLIGLVVLPWGGIVVALIGLVLIILFLLGVGRSATHPRTRA
jgi:hypothetical protein